ncbi:MAG: cytochrome c biogenesis protein CcsA [Alphaproteobacteria bacterium]|nr:cytochrome c biogenesis protein CcsA [Alphaproteobacteria bacterium]
MKRLLCLLLLLLTLPLHAEDRLPDAALAAFGRLPILHEGRVKPLDSFARIYYQAVTGQRAASGNTALAWLAQTMFNPAAISEQKQFLLSDIDATRRLGLPPRDDHRYSFKELIAALLQQKDLLTRILQSENRTLSADEKNLRKIYQTVDEFRQINAAMSLLLPVSLPLEPQARHDLGLAEDAPVNYRQLRRLKPAVMEALQTTVKTKQDKLEDYNEAEQRNAHLAYQLSLLESVGSSNTLLRVIPPLWDGDAVWRAPWDILEQSLAGPATQQFFDQWEQVARAWQQEDAAAWTAALTRLTTLTAQAHPANLRPPALTLEILLNQLQPFTLCLLLILGGLVLFALSTFGRMAGRAQRWLGLSARLLFASALAVHGFGILLRMLILQRPPVSTLYESTLFVSWVVLACGFWLALRRRNDDGLLIGGALAALLLGASTMFGNDGDTLLVLVAVLDTNFWLATHVVCITTGYAATLVTGMMAHLYLLRCARQPAEKFLRPLENIQRLGLFALLFTAVGTMLGGVWADQSWGRFWGWDPKENGALWIVLWLIWLVHGRIAGQFQALGFAVGMALVNIVVALAWFGVNLLSVGLHSYGFTDSAAYGLLGFCLGELVLINVLAAIILIRRQRGTHAH